jgi:hypothetical protein
VDWTDKESLVMAVYEEHGAVAASTTATAFHVCLDYHRALNRLHEQVGYDPKLRAQIERFGMTRCK